MTAQTATTRIYGYNRGAMLFHWLIALLIIVQLVMGFTMARIPFIADSMRFSMFQWHKTFGLLVLALTLGRIAWRIMNPPPAHGPMLKIEAITANIVAFLFYALMLLVPLTGWIMVSISPTAIPTLFFKITDLVWPNLPLQKDAITAHFVANAHMVLAYGFVVLLGLHVGGALKHMVIDRQPELSRMLPTKKLPRHTPTAKSGRVATFFVLAFLAGGLAIGQYLNHRTATPSSTMAGTNATMAGTNWLVDTAASKIDYTLDFSGEPKNGHVSAWQANIAFDPEALDKARAEITLDSNSISYEDSYVAGSIKQSDGLDVAQYPQIKVVLDQFTHQEGANYLAKGSVSIRGISLPVEVPFQFEEKDSVAEVHGSAKIDRLAFNIGKQNDATAQWLGKTITIQLYVKAQRK